MQHPRRHVTIVAQGALRRVTRADFVSPVRLENGLARDPLLVRSAMLVCILMNDQAGALTALGGATPRGQGNITSTTV